MPSWHSPFRALVVFGLLLGIPLAQVAYRTVEVTLGRALALLAAPLLPLCISTTVAAIEFRAGEVAMAAAGPPSRGTIAAQMADVYEVRLWGLVPASFLAAASLRRLSRLPAKASIFPWPFALIAAVVVTLAASATGSSFPRANPDSALWVSLAPLFALLASVGLLLVAPRLWPTESPPVRAIAIAMLVLLTTATCGAFVARIRSLAVAYGP